MQKITKQINFGIFSLTDDISHHQIFWRETKYRKNKQIEFNKKNNITPQSVKRNIGEIIESIYEKDSYTVGTSEIDKLSPNKFEKHVQKLEKKMLSAAENLDFEKAAMFRDEIRKLKKDQMGVNWLRVY